MNIEIGVGIGKGLIIAQAYDRIFAYSWATAPSPSVSTVSSVSQTINSVATSASAISLAPQISNAQNVSIVVSLTTGNADAVVPSVVAIRNVSVISVVANNNVSSLSPDVSNAQGADVSAMGANADAEGVIPAISVIRNVSVSAVIANGTTSTGVPMVTLGSGGTYYLQMDGVDDYLKTPSLTFDSIVMEIYIEHQPGVGRFYFDARSGATGYVYRETNNTERWNGNISKVLVNDIQGTWNTSFVPNATKITFKTIMSTLSTDDVSIFSNASNGQCTKGRIYSVKFYNGTTLVSHYDMATCTVQDQSGNGNHATLTGGTWMVA